MSRRAVGATTTRSGLAASPTLAVWWLRFNERRATEAAARFLKLCGGRMSYLKLVSMYNGPVVTRILGSDPRGSCSGNSPDLAPVLLAELEPSELGAMSRWGSGASRNRRHWGWARITGRRGSTAPGGV